MSVSADPDPTAFKKRGISRSKDQYSISAISHTENMTSEIHFSKETSLFPNQNPPENPMMSQIPKEIIAIL